MTCAHVVNVALKKVAGVESVDVSLNKGLATVKLKPGNTVTVPQLWELIHDKGYTPKATTVTARGEFVGAPGQLRLKVSGTNEMLPLVADPSRPTPATARPVIVKGEMLPGKDLKASAPLRILEVR